MRVDPPWALLATIDGTMNRLHMSLEGIAIGSVVIASFTLGFLQILACWRRTIDERGWFDCQHILHRGIQGKFDHFFTRRVCGNLLFSELIVFQYSLLHQTHNSNAYWICTDLGRLLAGERGGGGSRVAANHLTPSYQVIRSDDENGSLSNLNNRRG